MININLINRKRLLILNILLFLAIVVVMFLDWAAMSRRRLEIDYLSDALKSVKSVLPGNSTISFKSNLTGPDSTAIFYKSQFVLVPEILISDPVRRDTLLVIDNLEFLGLELVSNDIL